MNKEFFIVLDTETCNSIEQPLPYDIGWVVCDRQGNIYQERSFVIADTFLDMKDTMQSAYYAEKLPQYWEDIKTKDRQLKILYNVRKALWEDMKQYGITKVWAYNVAFDKRALNTLTRYTSKSFIRWFFPYGTELLDIWHPACQLLLARPSYIKFAEKNDLVSEKGNIQTSAEACYRYITNNTEFEEEHTGLADVKIETAILAKIFSQHKPFDSNQNTCCWRLVQKKRKEMATA